MLRVLYIFEYTHTYIYAYLERCTGTYLSTLLLCCNQVFVAHMQKNFVQNYHFWETWKASLPTCSKCGKTLTQVPSWPKCVLQCLSSLTVNSLDYINLNLAILCWNASAEHQQSMGQRNNWFILACLYCWGFSQQESSQIVMTCRRVTVLLVTL